VLVCLKAALTDLRSASLDLEAQTPGGVQLAGLVFGVGFADEEQHRALRRLWSAETTVEEFPDASVSDKHAHARLHTDWLAEQARKQQHRQDGAPEHQEL
jgi:hypothetical protein